MRPRCSPAAALRRLHPPLPLRRSECQTRGGGAGARAGGGGGAGGGRGRAGWAAPSPAPIGGHAAAHRLALVRHALSPLGFGVSANPQLSLPLPLGTQARPPRPMTSADPGRGRRKAAGRTDTRTAGPPRARRPRAERLAEGARSTFTIYRAAAARGSAH